MLGLFVCFKEIFVFVGKFVHHWYFSTVAMFLILISSMALAAPGASNQLREIGVADSFFNKTGNQRFGCPGFPNDLCIWPFEDIVMIFYDCISFSETGGVPPIHINVPPGQPLRFSILGDSDRFFAIISEAVANGNGVDPCVGGAGVFVGPVLIEPLATATPFIYEVPSAVVDQMIAQVNQDGFVVALAPECPVGSQLFVGLDFTRNPPPDATDLGLSLNSGPGSVFMGEDFDISVQLTNNGDSNAVDPVISFAIPLGATMVNGMVDGQPCQVNGNQVTCPAGTLPPLASVGGDFTFNAGLGGKVPFDFFLDSQTCDSNGSDNQLFVDPIALCPPTSNCFYGFGNDGGGTQTEIWVHNPVLGSPAGVRLFATDPNCTPDETPVGSPGIIDAIIAGGESFSFASQDSQPTDQPYIWWLEASSPDVIAEIRQIQGPNGPQPIFLGATDPFVLDDEVPDFDSDYPIPFFDIVTGENQVVHLVNLNPTAQSTTGSLRNAVTGNVTAQFNTTLEPFEIQSFPLDQLGLPGTDPQGFWKSGGQGVVAYLEDNTPEIFELFTPGLQPDGPPAQPFFQPDPMDLVYDPSELEMMVVKPNGSAVPPGSVIFAYDNDCGPLPASNEISLFGGGQPFSPILLPIDFGDQAGGFGVVTPPDTVSMVRWKEGDSQVWVKAQVARREWITHIPADSNGGDPMKKPARTRLLLRSEADTKLPVAAFGSGGNLLNIKFLDVPQGSHLYCLDDISLSDELDFLEFQLPPSTPGDIWFNAIADEPELEYKDQLPVHSIPQDTRVGNYTRVLEAWNGSGGTSCLGDAPDILDILDFMDNGLQCP